MSVDNFVRIYDNVMSKDICDVYINLFQKAKEASMVQDAGLTDTERKDSSFLLCDVNLDANNDFNLIPFISELAETAKFKNSVFITQNSKISNTKFVLLDK